MTMQNINLLNPNLLTPQVAFSSRTIAWILLGVLAAGGVAFAWAYNKASASEASMRVLQSERDALQAEYETSIQSTEGEETAEAQSLQTLNEAKQRLADLTRLETMLGQPSGPRASARLRALASEGVAGVWLTEIVFGVNSFQLSGRALDSSRIPDYLNVLARQPALADLRIDGFGILPAEAAGERDTPALPGRAFVVNPQTEAQP